MKHLIFISLFFFLSSNNGVSDTIFFKDGNQLNVPDTWEEDGKIKFRQDNSTIVGYEKAGILKVEKNALMDNPELDSGNEIVESGKADTNNFKNSNEAREALEKVKIFIEKNNIDNNIQSSGSTQKEIIQSDRNFIFDGFQWNILNLKKFRKMGRESDPQYSKNGCFVVVEAIVKNISDEPKYYCDALLLGRDKQYSDSSTVSVYGKYNLGYESNSFTKFEPGSNLQIFFGFDAIDIDEYTLILKNYDDRKKIKLTNFNHTY